MNTSRQERPQVLYAFGLSLVFVLIDWMVFTLLVEPLYRWLPIEPAWLCNAVHLLLLSLVGTLLGCLAFGAVGSRLRLVPWGYSFFPVYVVICILFVWLELEGEIRMLALQLVCLYTLSPTIVGMAVSWAVYFWLRRRKSANR
ncbi:MAG TPA: hypothetical protein IAC11_05680 [Candidatus Limiplasma pullicola]|nr:hypothetical protein [Candidatus Limiplasma pullicola]